MKFENMQYQRPDINEITNQYDDIIQNFSKCKTVHEQIEYIKKHEKIYSHFSTMYTLSNIRNTIDTSNEFYDKENKFLNIKKPIIQDKIQLLYKEILNSKFKTEIEKVFGERFIKNIEIELKTFSPEIIPLLQKESELELEYQTLIASAKIEIDGKIVNTSQLSAYKVNKNREIRKQAYKKEGEFYLSIKEKLDSIYDNLVKLRTQMAEKLGFKNFIELGYYRLGRDCYTEQEVLEYRNQIIKFVVPYLCERKLEQANRIDVDKIMLYDDTFIFQDGNPKPFGSAEDIMESGKQMYSEMDKTTNEFIHFMFENNLFDLVAKPSKAVGGYCTFISAYKSPFIFSNFNGTSADVDVFTHEAGHALQSYICKDIVPQEVRSPNFETCEIHSMSMEYLSWPWLKLFYKDQEYKAKFAKLEGTINFLPYGCMVDEFQHLIYTNPNMTPSERDKLWLSLEKKYRPFIDFDNTPFYKDGSAWQKQLHIYMAPFYYIDYCLAETIALQFLILSNQNFTETLKKYIKFCAIGGKLNFLESLDHCDLTYPFKDKTIEYLLEHIKLYMEKLKNKV